MTKQDWPEFNLLMGEMALAFRTDISQESIRVYGKHLADYSLDAVSSAVAKAIQTGERFPVIKTLRELANGYRPPQTRQPVSESVQISEFTETQIKNAKEEIQNIIGNLSAGMTAQV